jgi:hypothetical protein
MRDYYLKYKNNPWDWWAVVCRGKPTLDPDANNAGVTFITNLTASEAYYLKGVAERMLGAAWTPNQSPEERRWNKYVIDECMAILNRYMDD